jgi:hypothetical protein
MVLMVVHNNLHYCIYVQMPTCQMVRSEQPTGVLILVV